MSNWKTMIMFVSIAVVFFAIAYFYYQNHHKENSLFSANEEESNGSESSSSKKATLMLFYVDWCPHCKTAKPEWEDAKAAFDGQTINGYKVTFVEYNCTNENAKVNELMDKYSIEGYPTIKLLKDGEIISYEASVTKDIIDQFLHQML